MAVAYIYPEHRDILDGLISSSKVGSQLGAMATGPFKEQRDAYVFAVSIGLALGKPADEEALPKTKGRDPIAIRDNVLFGADGARELSVAALLLEDLDDSDETERSLHRQLDQVADADLTQRFALMDRYAYAGFSWLTKNKRDAGTIRDLIMEAIDKVIGVDHGIEDYLVGDDPLGGLLL